MNAVRAIKSAFSLAWVLLGVSLFMVFSLSDHYPGGYETMASHASALFIIATLVALGGLVVGTVWHRGKVSALWLTVGGLQVLGSLLVILVVFMLSRASQ